MPPEAAPAADDPAKPAVAEEAPTPEPAPSTANIGGDDGDEDAVAPSESRVPPQAAGPSR